MLRGSRRHPCNKVLFPIDEQAASGLDGTATDYENPIIFG